MGYILILNDASERLLKPLGEIFLLRPTGQQESEELQPPNCVLTRGYSKNTASCVSLLLFQQVDLRYLLKIAFLKK